NSHRPSPEVPPASTPAEVSAKFTMTSHPHGATPKSATHLPSCHFRIPLLQATQNPPSRAAQMPCTYSFVDTSTVNPPSLSEDTTPSRSTQIVPSCPRASDTTLATAPDDGDNTFPSRVRASSPA